MIQTDRYKKCRNDDNKPDSSEGKVVEKLVSCMSERLLDIQDSGHVGSDLDKGRDIENFSMNTVENDEKNQIDEGKCEHTLSIGRIGGISRGKKLLIRPSLSPTINTHSDDLKH